MPYTAEEIARRLNGTVQGDGSIVLTGFAPAQTAQPGHLTFAENDKYFAAAENSAASAILVEGNVSSEKKVLIRVPSARVGFAKVLPLFFPPPVFSPGIHPSSVVSPSAQIHPSAHIGPFCSIGEGVTVGANAVLEGGNFIGNNTRLGDDVRLFPNVTIYARTVIGNRVAIHAGTVVGSDGFGYVFDEGRHLKVPQIGNVVIQDDVEIGANAAIDRAALGSTVVGKGTKIDNLVMIAHNVVIGEHCIMVGQVGIAGSTKLGTYVTLAGQVGIAGHLKIGDRVIVGAQAGVMNNIPDGEKWLGTPAQPDREMKRQFVGMRNLPELRHRVSDLETQVEELKHKLESC